MSSTQQQSHHHQDISSINNDTTSHHQQVPTYYSPSKNLLVSEFAAECSRRNITPPPSVVQALQSTATNGGIFELQDCMMGEHAIAALCHALSYCFGPLRQKKLEEHGLEEDEDEIEELALRQLSLRNAYIGDQGCVAVLRFLIKNAVNTLEVLELPGNSLSESAAELATAVAVLVKLKKLNLDWNKIGATINTSSSTRTTSASSSSLRLQSEDNINTINNSHHQNNNTSSSSLEAPATKDHHQSSSSPHNHNAIHRLLNALATHHSIEQVSLQNNLLGRGAVEDLCHLLVTSRTLEHIDISWNSLSEIGGTRIANAVNRSASDKLTTVEIQGNSFSRKDCEIMERKLKTNREAGAKAEAARQQEDELKISIEKLQREVLDLRGQLTETRAKYSAQELLLNAAKEAENSSKGDREKFEKLMHEAQETLHQERMNFQRKLDEEHTRCSESIEQASRRLREACEAADDAQNKARVHRAEMDAEVASCRDRKYAAEKEAATAQATSQAAHQAMEKIQAEHTVTSRNLTESRQRVAELELQLKVRDDELERMRGAASSTNVELESAKSQMRQAQEQNEQLKLKVKDLEYTIEQAEKKRSEELRAALLRTENEQKEEVAAMQRQVKNIEQEKLQTEKTMVELKAQFENSRRQFEANAMEATNLAEKMREKCSELELELEKSHSKLSLLEIESGRSEGRAKSAEEKSRMLQNELQQSLSQHKDRIEELARDFERKLSDRESDLQEKQRESRVHSEEIALLKAKNDALSAKMRQQQVDLEKRVVKSLRSAMDDVRGGGGGHHSHNNNRNHNNNRGQQHSRSDVDTADDQ